LFHNDNDFSAKIRTYTFATKQISLTSLAEMKKYQKIRFDYLRISIICFNFAHRNSKGAT